MEQQTAPKSYLNTKIGYFEKNEGSATIYVGNLSYEKSETEIKDLFETYGFVNYVKLIKDSQTQKSKGIAFVQMPNRKRATKAISVLNGTQVDGRSIKVSIAVENNPERTVKKKRRKPYKAYVSKKDRAQTQAE